MNHRLGLIAAITACCLGGCRSLPTACTLELRVDVQPGQKTIAVGESFQAKAEGVSCGGRQRFPYEVAWRTSDTSVIRLDPETGRITGLAPGTATVTAHEPTVSADWPVGTVRIEVRAP